MHGFTYIIGLLEPVLANSLAGDANSARSLGYIPGALVRGAMIGAYLAANELPELDAAGDQTARRLFFDGSTRYLHAYPCDESGNQRLLPVPRSFHKRKNDLPVKRKTNGGQSTSYPIFDLSADTFAEEDVQLQGLEDKFCLLLGDTANSYKANEQLNVHTQRDARKGRATPRHGAVYRYEALAAGTQLAGVILTANAADAAQLKEWMKERIFMLGKARAAGYSRAKVIGPPQDIDDSWTEATPAAPAAPDDEEAEGYANDAPDEGDTFTLTLLSETIVRDENGHHTLDLLPALRQRLQRDDLRPLSDAKVFRKARVIGGFNRKWGLPLPQVAAIAAGSVFVVKADSPLTNEDRERLEALQQEGIGERRVEGFGRVAVNWHGRLFELEWREETKDQPPMLDDGATPLKEIVLSATERNLSQLILKRLLRSDLDRALRDAIVTFTIDGKDKRQVEDRGQVLNSQLSRWRSIARSAMSEPVAERLERLKQFYASEQKKGGPGWKQLSRTRIRDGRDAEHGGRKRLTDWVWEVLQDKKPEEGKPPLTIHQRTPWKWLNLASRPDITSRAFGEIDRFAADEELQTEYQLRLLDGVFALIAKQQKARDASDGGSHE
jgi:CRISPR-associated protein Csx10